MINLTHRSVAKDAAIIADQARVRRDLHPLRPGDELTVELGLLTAHRMDLVADRTRSITRLRALLTGIFPSLERELDLTNVGPPVLLTGYRTPAAIRRAGARRLETWLRNRNVRNAAQLAAGAVAATERQHTAVPGEKITARLVHSLAKEVMALNERIAETDKLVEGRFREHEHAAVIASMPGIGPCSAPSSSPRPVATRPRSPSPTASPPSPASPRPHVIRARSAATCTAPSATTGASNACSTPPR